MKKVASERLYNLVKDEASLEQMRDRIQSLELQCSAIRAAGTDGNPVKGGGNGRGEWLDNNIQERDYLQKRFHSVEIEVRAIRNALSMLTEEQRRILDVFFIHRVSHPEDHLAETMGVDRSTIFRKRNKALFDLAHILYGGVEV